MLWRRARKAIAAIALALFWFLSAGWLTAPMLAYVQRDAMGNAQPRFGETSVIVLLGAGTHYDEHGVLVPKPDALPRIATTASLYAQCKQQAKRCEVIVSGGNPQRHSGTEADTYAPYLLRAQVAQGDLVLENTSRTTYENAERVAHILRTQRYDSLMLVTSAYHIPRALVDFRRFALRPTPVACDLRVAERGVLPRWSNLVSANIAMHELIGMVQFYVYRTLGWF